MQCASAGRGRLYSSSVRRQPISIGQAVSVCPIKANTSTTQDYFFIEWPWTFLWINSRSRIYDLGHVIIECIAHTRTYAVLHALGCLQWLVLHCVLFIRVLQAYCANIFEAVIWYCAVLLSEADTNLSAFLFSLYTHCRLGYSYFSAWFRRTRSLRLRSGTESETG